MESQELKYLKEIEELKEGMVALVKRNSILENRLERSQKKVTRNVEFMGLMYSMVRCLNFLSNNYNPNISMRAKYLIAKNNELREKYELKPWENKFDKKETDEA